MSLVEFGILAAILAIFAAAALLISKGADPEGLTLKDSKDPAEKP